MAKKVCIVGASGQLGRYMIQHTPDRGYEVVGVYRQDDSVTFEVSRSTPYVQQLSGIELSTEWPLRAFGNRPLLAAGRRSE